MLSNETMFEFLLETHYIWNETKSKL